MWSCLSGSAGSRWLALEVQLTPVWTISRSGENLLVLPWLFMFHVEEETLNISLSVPAVTLKTCRSGCRCFAYVARAGSRLWQTCFYKYANNCRNCKTRTRNTAAPMSPTSLIPWQKLRNTHCVCSQNFLQSERWHQDSSVLYTVHRLIHFLIVDMFLLCSCFAVP